MMAIPHGMGEGQRCIRTAVHRRRRGGYPTPWTPPPPDAPPPHLPMFEADSQNFASAPSAPRGLKLWLASGGDHRGTQGGGNSSQTPLPPPSDPPPPLLIHLWGRAFSDPKFDGAEEAPAPIRVATKTEFGATDIAPEAPPHPPGPPARLSCRAPRRMKEGAFGAPRSALGSWRHCSGPPPGADGAHHRAPRRQCHRPAVGRHRKGVSPHGAQPMPDYCPPGGKCRLQWHL